MSKTERTTPAALLCLLLALLSRPAFAAGYDVSYLWHSQLPSVEQYRSKVGAVLGPDVAKRLRIVQKPGLYGLIYYRNGSDGGAEKVAAAHTRLLRARGLERAAPMRSIKWNFVNAPSPNPPAAKTASVAPAEKTSSVAPAASLAPAASPPKPAATSAASRQRVTDIENAVEKYIKGLRAKGVITADERTAWSVYDFTTGEKLVGINEDVQFQAASLVKPFFATAFFHKVARGELKYGPESRMHMERMIQRSNNHSTNWIMRQVGGPAAVQRILSGRYGGIFRDTHIVEYIPAGGKTYRNKASVHDYSRFLYALWTEELPGSAEIKRVMSLPSGNRVYTGARAVPAGTQVYNKTGSTAHLCGDMGILVVKDKNGKSYPYTIIGVIEKDSRARNYTTWIRSRGNVIRQVSNIVYEGISQYHGLRS